MNMSQQTHEQIEKFLAGELSGDDLKQVEEKYQTDPSFKMEVDLQEAAHKVVEISGDLALKEKLRAIEAELNASSQKKAEHQYTSKNLFLRVAAVIVVLFASVIIFNVLQPPTPKALFSEHFETYRAPVNTRSQNAPLSEQWQQASQLYRTEDFGSAAEAFEEILKDHQQEANYLVHFYLAMSYLSKENTEAEKAISHFKIVFQTDNDHHQQAHWYLALAYLSLENEKAARVELNKLLQQHNRFKKQEAQEILHELE